jgi:DNA-binding response OmpR family regulator
MGSHPALSALVVDPDAGIRKMISVLLRRGGFRTQCFSGIEAVSAVVQRRFDVIVRDLHDVTDLTGTPAAILRRTVIVTTAPERLMQGRTTNAFAVLRKPFDIDALVQTVTACARAQREERSRAPGAEIRSLRHFMESVPALRNTLAAVPVTPRELLLHTEMRRTILKLSTAFYRAAEAEASSMRAAAFLAASVVAAELAEDCAARAAASH